MSAALVTTPRPVVEALLVAIRELDVLQRRDPGLSGRLRLRLSRARREWRTGHLTDGQFGAAVDAIVCAGQDITGAH